jgi:hypothetical protein
MPAEGLSKCFAELEIQADTFIEPQDWKPLYLRYLMEYDWLRGIQLQEHWPPADVVWFSNIRATTLRSIEELERKHKINTRPPSQRWQLNDPQHDAQKENARNIWLVDKDLHWRNILNDQGHSKFMIHLLSTNE